MRDRFISVAISREPQAPAFRVPDRTTALTTSESPDGPITEIPGIGPVYATRLAAIDITTLAALRNSRPEQVAAAAQVPLSRAVGWIDHARQLNG